VFRNVAYLPREQAMRLYTWDENGKRITVDSTYEPYIFLETTHNEDCLSIFNTKLRKKRFKHQAERSQYLKDNNITRVFENLGVQQQFLIDYFGQENEKPDFAKHQLKVHFIDIETYSPDSFPDIESANHPINVITIYDTLSEKFITWGTKQISQAEPNVTYVYCKTERDLLSKFLDYFSRDYPDILSGWNSEFFDIPYIVNRITRILGEDEAKRLSPIGRIRSRTFMGKFGREQTRWHLEGLSCVDYYQIYRRFCPILREMYKLGYIGEVELGETKIDYGDTDLASLSDDNWDLFVKYNIQDVNLLVRLEQKLQYIQLLRMIAYAGLTTLEGALGSLSVITGLCAIRARGRNQRIPTFNKGVIEESTVQNAGAYVGEPQPGFQQHVVSFDANSLYPNVMITLNLSPETKIGSSVKNEDGTFTIKHVNGTTYNLTREKFATFIKQEQIAISKANTDKDKEPVNILFSQKTKGIVPDTVDHYYKKRVEIKKLLDKAKRKIITLEKNTPEYDKLKNEIDNLNITQHTIKILINTVYGYFGNKHSPLGDDQLAEAITLTGQATIKQSNHLLLEYIKSKTNMTDEELQSDTPIIYNDTDSSYISIKHIVKHLGIEMLGSDGKITTDYLNLVKDIEAYLNTNIMEWGKRSLGSKDCRLIFKREKIADVGLFIRKKRYVLHILDDEGIPCNKFKYTGVEVVRTTMAAAIKSSVKKIIETMILTRSKTETDKVFDETYALFTNLKAEEISSPSSIKNYEKYANQCNEFKTVKSMPKHVKAAYFYNVLLERFNLTRKYEKIASGDNMKYFPVRKPNKFGLSAIGYKYDYPKEFNEIFTPDHESVFEKDVYSVIQRFYECVKWQLKKPSDRVQTDLFELLGM
jgi:DNA polymerase elongation subunit (family B)